MNVEHPIFEAIPGTVISVFSAQPYDSSICGYCRALVLEDDRLHFVGGFRRYTDRIRRNSWAEPVEWATTPIAQVSIRIVPEKNWMRTGSRPDCSLEPEKRP